MARSGETKQSPSGECKRAGDCFALLAMTLRSLMGGRTWLTAIAAGLLAVGSAAISAPAAEISDGVVKIGLILDLSGPYSENTGQGSAAAAKMAVADFGGKVLRAPIELLLADHRDGSDRAGSIARGWFDAPALDALFDGRGAPQAPFAP